MRKLLDVLARLLDAGNTVVVVEHQLDVIKSADHVIDMGPEAGAAGGRVVVAGTPEEVAASPESHTGRYLRAVLGSGPRREQGPAAGEAALLARRSEFPILENTTYLVSHSLGAMPRGAAEKLADYTQAWATRGVRAWGEGWWDMPGTVGDGGRADRRRPRSVVMHQNVSVCQSVVLSCFDLPAAQQDRLRRLNFPSVMYVYEGPARSGARIVRQCDDGMTVPLDRFLAAIDETTLLVPLSHVIFKSGVVQDVAAIVRRAHEVGALVVPDLYQSAGTVPVDVKAWDVDFATGGSVKWLCGGPGAGYLYVAPRLHDRLRAARHRLAAHAPVRVRARRHRLCRGAERFLHGTPGVPRCYAAQAGYEIVASLGVDAIRRKSLRQTRSCSTSRARTA